MDNPADTSKRQKQWPQTAIVTAYYQIQTGWGGRGGPVVLPVREVDLVVLSSWVLLEQHLETKPLQVELLEEPVVSRVVLPVLVCMFHPSRHRACCETTSIEEKR